MRTSTQKTKYNSTYMVLTAYYLQGALVLDLFVLKSSQCHQKATCIEQKFLVSLYYQIF